MPPDAACSVAMHFNSSQSRSAWTEQVSLSRRSLQVQFCFYTSATQSERQKCSRRLLPSSYLHHHRFSERESFASQRHCHAVCIRASITFCTLLTLQEDDLLRNAVGVYGERSWANVAQLVPGRSSKSCSDRCVCLSSMLQQ